MNQITIGFIGLGAMGTPMSRNLLQAGYPLIVYDLNEKRLADIVSAGAKAASSAADLVKTSDWIITSLPSSAAFVGVVEKELLPNCNEGQIFIDVGTVTPPEARRLASAFEAKGSFLLEAPVSGGPGGAERADLYMFVGGNPDIFERCRSLLEVLGEPSRITYCGASGAGQVVKGVNQLMMGLADAAYLEAIAFGVRGGVNADIICQALGSQGRWRADFNATATRVAKGQGETVGVKFRELSYFLQEAQVSHFSLPLTQTLYRFCDAGERVVIDDNRPAPSFWRQLQEANPKSSS